MPINNCYSLLMENQMIKSVLEAAILAAGEPVSLERLRDLFADEQERPTQSQLKKRLQELIEDYQHRGIHLKQLASGYCLPDTGLRQQKRYCSSTCLPVANSACCPWATPVELRAALLRSGSPAVHPA